MAKVEFDLEHGVEIGSQLEKHVVLKEATAGDIIDASVDSERVVFGQDGQPVLVPSPSLMGAQTLCRQVERLGSINGPLELSILKKLHEDDFVLMQQKAEELHQLADQKARELTARGKSADNSAGS